MSGFTKMLAGMVTSAVADVEDERLTWLAKALVTVTQSSGVFAPKQVEMWLKKWFSRSPDEVEHMIRVFIQENQLMIMAVITTLDKVIQSQMKRRKGQ